MTRYSDFLAHRQARDADMDRRARAGEWTFQQLVRATDTGRISVRDFRRLVPLLPTSSDWLDEQRNTPAAEGAVLVYAGPLEDLDGAVVESAILVEPGNLMVELSLPDFRPVRLIGVAPAQLLWMPNNITL